MFFSGESYFLAAWGERSYFKTQTYKMFSTLEVHSVMGIKEKRKPNWIKEF